MLACSRLRDSRVRWIEKAQTGESFVSSPLSESLEQAIFMSEPYVVHFLNFDDKSRDKQEIN